MLWVLSKSHGKEIIIQARNPVLVCAKGSSSVLQQEGAKTGFRIVQELSWLSGNKPASQGGSQLSPGFWRQCSLWMSLLGLSSVYWRHAKVC